jgi:hypothetical protein
MTLEELKEGIESIALSIEGIKTFDVGEDALLATGAGTDYPMIYMEIPYNINYEIKAVPFKTVQFALLVLFKGVVDNVKEDHRLISNAEQIGDVLLKTIKKDLPEFKMDSANGVSVREFSDDSCAGVRIEVTGKILRSCSVD